MVDKERPTRKRFLNFCWKFSSTKFICQCCFIWCCIYNLTLPLSWGKYSISKMELIQPMKPTHELTERTLPLTWEGQEQKTGWSRVLVMSLFVQWKNWGKFKVYRLFWRWYGYVWLSVFFSVLENFSKCLFWSKLFCQHQQSKCQNHTYNRMKLEI